MKVIHVTDCFSCGGVLSFLYDLCIAQKKKGMEVLLVSILKGNGAAAQLLDQLQYRGIKIECLEANSVVDAVVKYVGKLRKIIKDFADGECAAVNVHLKLGVLMGALATAGMNNVRCIETYHNEYSHYFLEHWVLQPRIKKYIAIEENVKQEMLRRFHTPERKIKVILNGIDCEAVRERLLDKKSENKHAKFLSVGRLTHSKNFDVSIGGFKLLDRNDFSYSIIGDGELWDELYNLQDSCIKLLGSKDRSDVLNYVDNADMVVMPSKWEGLSIFQLEVLTIGCPMMLSDIPSFREVMDEEPLGMDELYRVCRWGYLVKVNDEEAYCRAAQHYLNHRELKDSFRLSISTIAPKFDIKITADKYIKAYHDLFKK